MNEFRLGAIGCGGFGRYALDQFRRIPGIRIVALSEPNPRALDLAQQQFQIGEADSVTSLCGRPDIDLVYVATPPFLHCEHALAAARGGKHVICEKPLALTLSQTDEMLHAAADHGVFLVANLLQRYNKVSDLVIRLIESQMLGQLRHGFFENYASDDALASDHWFWDRNRSGGIFIEHGVHFFDLFEAWLGAGEVLSAQCSTREGTDLEDQVQCCVRYRNDVLISFYHGFHQTRSMDRQELRLVFERGDVKLFGWIPTVLEINAVVDSADGDELARWFPSAQVNTNERLPPGDASTTGPSDPLGVDRKIRIVSGQETQKMERYGELVQALLRDQLEWAVNPSHQRRVTERNGRQSLKMAIRATELAHV